MKSSVASLQGFCQALLGESGVSPIYPKTDLAAVHCQWRAPDADVPGEVGSGVSAAMDDIPFPYLTRCGD